MTANMKLMEELVKIFRHECLLCWKQMEYELHATFIIFRCPECGVEIKVTPIQ